GFGAINDILAGQAGHVRAGAANHRSFDDDGFLALFRQGPGEDFACYPAANHQVLKVLDAHDDAPVSSWGGVALVETTTHSKPKSMCDPSPAMLTIRQREVFRGGQEGDHG